MLGLMHELSPSMCDDPSYPGYSAAADEDIITISSTTTESVSPYLGYTKEWSKAGCYRIVALAQLTFAAGVVAATLLQFVGALCVREYAKSLFVLELQEEARLSAFQGRISCSEQVLPIIFEDAAEEQDEIVEKTLR